MEAASSSDKSAAVLAKRVRGKSAEAKSSPSTCNFPLLPSRSDELELESSEASERQEASAVELRTLARANAAHRVRMQTELSSGGMLAVARLSFHDCLLIWLCNIFDHHKLLGKPAEEDVSAVCRSLGLGSSMTKEDGFKCVHRFMEIVFKDEAR